MGREVRRVPPNWVHPSQPCRHGQPCMYPDPGPGKCFKPMFKENYDLAASRWLRDLEKFEAEKASGNAHNGTEYFWDWDGSPPDKEYYVSYSEEEATWYQLYETVSEGCPVTPPFKTERELVEYLIKNGDYWDQRRKSGPWSKAAAERMMGSGYAPSMIISNGKMKSPKDMDEL